ncbi:uncharacterized protein [Physcomitrium patens]|nr:uncharacterized protein LOC112286271 isoform X2 [Physcomitrium patens]PNR48066.1 hypothetical protein PHYPA_012539 [Physcomitrium patens]|eukprot:XP_024383775.1 uncharacterized protein LOC112286271 isoform X2 [Physcomitrella patens]
MTTPIASSNMPVEGLHERRTNGDKPNGGHPMDVEAQEKIPIGIHSPIPPAPAAIVEEEEDFKVATVSYADIAKQFSLLGWVAFGGPAAHIALFQKRLVERLRWLTLPVYLEIFALCQCLPGPASTQVSFALGVLKKGVLGGLLSGILFQYPGAIIMTAIGVFAAKKLENPQGWLDGIAAGVAAVGIALVASASKSMCRKLCATPLLATICTVTAVIAFYWPKPYTFPAVIVGSGLVTIFWSYYKKETPKKKTATEDSAGKHGFGVYAGAVLITVWLVALVITLIVRRASKNPSMLLQWWEVFYRTGSVIYGGGQVVLPMLYTDLVQQDCNSEGVCQDNPSTWVTSTQFYAGLGVQQALPGPLFNFSAYLGTIMAIKQGYTFVVGAIIAWLGIFVPGILLIFGMLPFWGKFRNWGLYNRALPGLNAAGIGLIVTSVFSLTLGAYKQSPFPNTSICIGILGFTAVDQLHWLEPLVVVGGGVVGVIAWALNMS